MTARPNALPATATATLASRFVRPASAASRVADAVREQIEEGAFAPGAQLVEESLTRALGVSRNTVREAFSVLGGERIVVRIPNRGVFVARPGPDDVRDLYATRILIEPSVLRWAPGLSADALVTLRRAVSDGQAGREQEDWEAVALANQRFHRCIVFDGGSIRLRSAFTAVLAEMRLVFLTTGNSSFHAPYVDENDAVTTLLEQGRGAEAADHLAGYLGRARDDLLGRLESPVRDPDPAR